MYLKKIMKAYWDTWEISLLTKLCPTLCNPMDCSTPGFPVFHHLSEFAQAHVQISKFIL